MRRQLREAGIRVVLIPECAPNANAYAQRFVRSIKEECFDRIIPIGEHHFRRAVAEFVQHIIVNGITKGSTIDSGRHAGSEIGRASCRERVCDSV